MPMGRGEISDCGFRIADFKVWHQAQISNSHSEILNPQFEDWWRRRESNSDPEANAEGLYMLSRFSFSPGQLMSPGRKFALCRVSEATRPRQELVRLCSRPFPRTEGMGQL